MTTEHIDNVQCTKLWQSVIVTAIMDAVRPKPNTNSGLSEWRRNQREADQWIRDKRPEFRTACLYAGLDPDFIHDRYTSGVITCERIGAVKKEKGRHGQVANA